MAALTSFHAKKVLPTDECTRCVCQFMIRCTFVLARQLFVSVRALDRTCQFLTYVEKSLFRPYRKFTKKKLKIKTN